MKPHNLDPITTPPAITGKHGRAWAVDLDAARRGMQAIGRTDATVSAWIIEAPWAHPLWHSYRLVLVHLRPMDDGRPTKFYIPGATHEIWLEALDPNHSRQPAIDGLPAHTLRPMNFGAQFIEPDDAAAALRVAGTVQMVCDGRLSPDTDFIRQWVALYGDNMLRDRAGRVMN